jgi:integrase
LQSSAVDFFRKLAGDRPASEFLFLKSDGTRWKSSEQTRPIKLALEKAKLDPLASLYTLRHTYISEAIERNTPLTIIAENCGTSVRMIETNYAHILLKHRRKFIEQGAPVFENNYRAQNSTPQKRRSSR